MTPHRTHGRHFMEGSFIMVGFLFLLAVAASLVGIRFFFFATGELHEIEGLICFLISAVLFVGGAIVDEIYIRPPPQ